MTDSVSASSATVKVDYEGIDVSAYARFITLGWSAVIVLVALCTPSGPCICFARGDPPFISWLPGAFCYGMFTFLSLLAASTAYEFITDQYTYDTQIKEGLAELTVFTGCSD